MGQVQNAMGTVCEANVANDVETIDHPDHPGASRVPYALMNGYYGSVCKMVRGGEDFGTGWLIRLSDLPHIGKDLKDPNTQAIVTAKSCCPTKESATSYEAIFDYVDDTTAGKRCALDPSTFYYSGAGTADYIVVALREFQKDRKPLQIGLNLTDAQLPAGATVTVVSHPAGLPREVSHGHITRVDEDAVYYNAGAKAATGSAVFFAYQKDLHVIAMGLKSAGSEIHEVVGVRTSKFSEVFYDEALSKKNDKVDEFQTQIKDEDAGAPQGGDWGSTGPAGAPQAAPATATAGPMETMGGSRIGDVKEMKITLPNKQQVTYTGQVKLPANVPHGQGTAVYDHGVTYIGEWDKGNRHGPGKITNVKEGYYSTGEVEDDLFIGTWTKYNSKDDTVMEEQHYDHSTFDTVRRHMGMSSRKATPKEDESPAKDAPQKA